MATLYLRNVPDDVVAKLQRLAEREAMSVSGLAVRELTEAARRADNAALLGSLPDLGVSFPEILEDLTEARSKR